MKAHVGTDTKGVAHSVVVVDECLHGEEEEIYGDKASVSAERKRHAEARGVMWRVLRKATTKRKLTCADTRKSNRTGPVWSTPVIKNLWRYRKVRYKGLAKNAGQSTRCLP